MTYPFRDFHFDTGNQSDRPYHSSTDIKGTGVRILSTGILLGGVGLTGFNVYKDMTESFKTLRETRQKVKASRNLSAENPLVQKTLKSRFIKESVSDIFEFGSKNFSEAGWQEVLRRTYERALFKSGMTPDTNERKLIVKELMDSGGKWSAVEEMMGKYGAELGGEEGFKKAIGSVLGRGKNASSIIGLMRKKLGGRAQTDFEPIGPAPARSGVLRQSNYYPTPATQPGKFWQEIMPDVTQKNLNRDIGQISPKAMSKLNKISNQLGSDYSAQLGFRDPVQGNGFRAVAPEFKLDMPRSGLSTNVPFFELKIKHGKQVGYFKVPMVPDSLKQRGINLVANNGSGMSFSAVGHFAMPKAGGGVEVVDWNRMISIALHGNDKAGIDGLGIKIHKMVQEGKSMREISSWWNTFIDSQMQSVNSGQGSMAVGLLHQHTVVPFEHLWNDKRIEWDDITKLHQDLTDAGYEPHAPKGVGPVAEQGRLQLSNFNTRYDIFGSHFDIERRWLQRVREFDLTDHAKNLAANMPINGLSRFQPIGATEAYLQEINQSPMARAIYSLKPAKHLRPEEGFYDSKIAGLMNRKIEENLVLKYDPSAGFGIAPRGQFLQPGQLIGVDYSTGEDISAYNKGNKINQRILNANIVGDKAYVSIETSFPAQDQIKMYGIKGEFHQARTDIQGEAVLEYGIKVRNAHNAKILRKAELILDADVLKKNLGMVYNQMAEGMFLVASDKIGSVISLKQAGKTKGLWMFVNNKKYREKLLRSFAKQADRGGDVGLRMLQFAKKHGFTPEELASVGGLFYQIKQKAKDPSNVSALHHVKAGKLLSPFQEDFAKGLGIDVSSKSGLSDAIHYLGAMEEAEIVQGMPQLNIGGYAPFRIGKRVGVDPRGLRELRMKNWAHDGAELLVRDIASHVIPSQNLTEMDRAIKSIMGESMPEDIRRINRFSEAAERLGKESFVFSHPLMDRELYIPGPSAEGMGQFRSQQGLGSESLRKKYVDYLNSLKKVRDYGDDEARMAFGKAEQALTDMVATEFLSAGSLRGEVIGSRAGVSKAWLGNAPGTGISHSFGSVDDFLDYANKGPKPGIFTWGVGKRKGLEMFDDLIRSATDPGDLVFLELQKKAFLAGEDITGWGFRHPQIKVQSSIPVKFRMVEGAGDAVLIPKVEVKLGDRVLDLSGAVGMDLDNDGDNVVIGFIANKKAKEAIDKVLETRAYRQEYLDDVHIKTDLHNLIKSAAPDLQGHLQLGKTLRGLERLAGVQLATGAVSHTVSQLKVIASFYAGEDFNRWSHLLGVLEQSPISSKHGLMAGDIAKKLREFGSNKGTGTEKALVEVWQQLFNKHQEFTAGPAKYKMEQDINQLKQWVLDAEENKQFQGYKMIVEEQARIGQGKVLQEVSQVQLKRMVNYVENGYGDPLADLTRAMRIGEGAADQVAAGKNIMAGQASGQMLKNALKKHWHIAAAGAAGAAALAWLATPSDLRMPDRHPLTTTDLAMGGSARLNVQPSMTNRIITTDGGTMPIGVEGTYMGEYSSSGLRDLMNFGLETRADIMIRDNRGSITPEYIDKVQREHYI